MDRGTLSILLLGFGTLGSPAYAQSAATGISVPPPKPPKQGEPDLDFDSWETWWDFNKDLYLDLRHRASQSVFSGDSDVLVGLERAAAGEDGFRPSRPFLLQNVAPALHRVAASGERDLVIPALLSIAKTAHDPEADLADLIPFLRRDEEMAETAALAIGGLPTSGGLDVLVDLLEDSPQGRKWTGSPTAVPSRLRAFAAYGLGLRASRIPPGEDQETIRAALWKTLIDPAPAPLDARLAAILSLAKGKPRDPQGLVDDLFLLLQDRNQHITVRAQIPNTIRELLLTAGDRQALNAMAERFGRILLWRFAPYQIRRPIAQSLGLMVEPGGDVFDATAALLQRASIWDRDLVVRRFSLLSLAYLGAKAGPGSKLVQEVLVPHFLDRMLHAPTLGRPWAGLALGIMVARSPRTGGVPWPAILGHALEVKFRDEKNPNIRVGYAMAMGLAHDENAAEEIFQFLAESKVTVVQGSCAIALALMGARQFQDEMFALLKTSGNEPELLRDLSIALTLLRDRRVVPALLQLLQDDANGPPSGPVIQAVATSLAILGDRRGVLPLLRLLPRRSISPTDRALVVQALGYIADEHPFPAFFPFAQNLNYTALLNTATDPAAKRGFLNRL